MPKKTPKLLLWSTALLALLLVGVLAARWLWPEGSYQQLTHECHAEGETQHCVAFLPSGERIELGRQGALRSLALQQLWLDSAVNLTDARVIMEGRDMYVGRLHYRLQPGEQSSWQGRGAVGNCIDDEMPWLAHYLFSHRGQQYRISLEFTIRDGVF